MKQKQRNIGVQVSLPKPAEEYDKKCPFYGDRVVRGRTLVGKVVNAKAKRSAIIEIERRIPMRKYERFEKRKTRIMVHNPDSIAAKENDIVKVMETRKLSKMKNFVIVEKVKTKGEKK
jgi:small subunit ribosomal protein S17